MEKLKLSKMRRSLERSDLKIDAEARTVEFSFSSERPVERWFGKEILSHEPDAADLERLNGGANHLFNHDWDKPIGVVEKAWPGADRRLHARVRFSKNDFADQVFKDIEDGILKNVSFGYEISEIGLTEEKDGAKTYTATKWMPFEISTVTVPADHTVGIGRSAPTEGTEIMVRDMRAPKPPFEEPAEPVIQIIENKTAAPAAQKGKNMDDVLKQERERNANIMALGEKFGKTDAAREFIASGKTVDEFRALLLEQLKTDQPPIASRAEIGLSQKEIEQFSFVRAINALANPTNRAFQEAAKYEMEVSAAGAAKVGKQAKGIFVPYEVLVRHGMNRAQTVGSSSGGGHLVGTDHRPDMFIDILRKKSALDRAGATMISGLVGNIEVPKQTGASTAYWVGEAGEPSESAITLGQVAMGPKTIAAYVDMTRRLLLQSTPDIEMLVKKDIATQIALGIDLAGMYGSGSANQPRGIVNTSGICAEDFAAANPTFEELVNMESRIASTDADVETMKYLFNAKMRGHMKSTVKFASTDSQTIWEQGNTVNGYNTVVSNQLTDGDVLFGNFADLIIGMWSGLDLNVDTAALAKSGGLRVIAFQDVDVAVRRVESFCLGNDDQTDFPA